MTATQIQIIIEILILILGLYLAFFKSYFQEKGKNLATKEDIGEITQTVEKIKNQMAYSTQSMLSLKTEERNAIVNCYEKYHYWENVISDTDLGGLNETSKARLIEFENKMNDAYFHFELSEARMHLFINNSDLTKAIVELKKKTLEFQHLCERHLDLMQAWILEWEQTTAFSGMLNKDKEKEQLLKRKNEMLANYRKEKLEQYKSLTQLSGRFQLASYNHIQSLAKAVD